MNAEEFFSYHGNSKTGVSDWLRRLPFTDPTLVPNEFGDPALARQRINSAGQSMKVRVNTRSIDGALWVMKSEKESN